MSLFAADPSEPCNKNFHHQKTDLSNAQTNVVYKILCKDCSWSYNGETKKSLKTWKEENLQNNKHNKFGSNITKHAWDYQHEIDFQNTAVINRAK